MAAEGLSLDEQRRLSGAALLAMTDDVGFQAAAAAWVLTDSGRWQYLLATPMVDRMGPRWIYDRLVRVFQKLRLPPGITPLDIFVASPDEAWIAGLPIEVDRSSGGVDFYNNHVNGVAIPSMVIYRLLPKPRQAQDPSLRFDAKVKQLLAA
jgi:hypothetical protein